MEWRTIVNDIIPEPDETTERRYAAQTTALQWVGEHRADLADAHEISVSSDTDGTSTIRVLYHVQNPSVPLARARVLHAKALTVRYHLSRAEVVPGGVTYRGRVFLESGKGVALHVVISA
jgi:hypothetical protein